MHSYPHSRKALGPALVLAAAIVVTAASAQLAGPPSYDLSWSTIDGGGGTSTGGGAGGFSLSGTIGQPDAGGPLTGGAFALTGGFWPGAQQPTCPADLTGDGLVGVGDLLALIGAWGTTGASAADLNGDLVVSVGDLLALISVWGSCA